MKKLHVWAFGYLLTTLVVIALILWVDRPICLFLHQLIGQSEFFARFVDSPGLFLPLAAIAPLMFVLRRCLRYDLARFDIALILSLLSVLLAFALRFPLKFLFGRTWPYVLIYYDIFEFNPFHAGGEFGSFPSGHTAAICAFLSVFWAWYPKYRALFAACILGGGTFLVIGNYHFVGDIIAGGVLGFSCGLLVGSLWESQRRRGTFADGFPDLRARSKSPSPP
jgi:membrane-associated phospholipid phosphatase